MRTLPLGNIAVVIAIAGWSIGMAMDKPPRKLGPEWKKDGEYFHRTMEIPVKRRVLDSESSTRYTVEMEDNTLFIDERDGNGGLSVDCSQNKNINGGYMKVASRTDMMGKVREFTVNLKKNVYFDLDGDGMIDAFYDMRGKDPIPMVIFEGRHVQVEDFISGFTASKGEKVKMWGIGRKVKYVFEGSAWVEVPQK